MSCIEGGTISWMSPELLDPERFGLKKSRPTKESDCYALGMVIYEVLSGQIPFHPSAPFIVIAKVLEGKRPARPEGERGRLFTNAIWRLLELSWEEQPRDRPNAKAVLSCLEGNPPPPCPSLRADRCSGVIFRRYIERFWCVISFHFSLTPDCLCDALGLSSSWPLKKGEAGVGIIDSLDRVFSLHQLRPPSTEPTVGPR